MTDRRRRVVSGTDADGDVVDAALDAAAIRLILPAGTPTWRHQMIAITLVDLLGRLFPRLDARCDSDAHSAVELPPGPERLADRLAGAQAHGGLPALPVGDHAFTVHIGPGEEPADLYVDG